MALDKNDLKAIKGLFSDEFKVIRELIKNQGSDIQRLEINLKDYTDFAIEGSEHRMGQMMDEKLNAVVMLMDEKLNTAVSKIIARMDRDAVDIGEINSEFILKFDNHEKRIVRLEKKIKV